MSDTKVTKGYRLARSTHGIDRPGNWFFEVFIGRDGCFSDDELCDNNSKVAYMLSDSPQSRKRFPVGGGGTPSADPKFREEMKGHVRIGITQILAQTEAPVGFDEYGYGIRDTDGATIHCATVDIPPRSFGFSAGDVVGVLVCLPGDQLQGSCSNLDERPVSHGHDSQTKDPMDKARSQMPEPGSVSVSVVDTRSFDAIKNRPSGDGMIRVSGDKAGIGNPQKRRLSDPEDAQLRELKDFQRVYRPLGLGEYRVRQALQQGSYVKYFVNGKEVGQFSPLYRGKYYPSISLYGESSATINCGPKFRFLPRDSIDPSIVSPISDLAEP